jgi:hypothetical protein
MLASSLQLVLGVVAFSSSLQLGLSLGHQPLRIVEIGELELELLPRPSLVTQGVW